MAAVTALETFEVSPNAGLKHVVLTLANTTDASDTLAVTLSNHGISATGLLICRAYAHTTDGSVIVGNTATTSVSAGVLTVTLPADSSTDQFRVIELIGKADIGDFS